MKVVIIGAGAAGLTAAICAAKNGDKVTVIEHEKNRRKRQRLPEMGNVI